MRAASKMLSFTPLIPILYRRLPRRRLTDCHSSRYSSKTFHPHKHPISSLNNPNAPSNNNNKTSAKTTTSPPPPPSSSSSPSSTTNTSSPPTTATTTSQPSPSPSSSSSEMVKVRHIQVQSHSLASTLLSQLQTTSTTFSSLARLLSQCESKTRDGNLGWIRRGMMVPSFEAQVFAMQPGETRLVQTDFGWHVVRVEGRADGGSEMEVSELAGRLGEVEEGGLVVVDVRERVEIERCDLKGVETVKMPMGEYGEWADVFERGESQLGREFNREVVVMCHHGVRSKEFCKFLGQAGFRKVRNLSGGIQKWAEEVDPSVGFY